MTTKNRSPAQTAGEPRRVFWHSEIEKGRVRPLPALFHWDANGRRVRLRPDPWTES
jgi:hypothetical protein